MAKICKHKNKNQHNKVTFHAYVALKYLQILNVSGKPLIRNDVYLVMLQTPRIFQKYNYSMVSSFNS